MGRLRARPGGTVADDPGVVVVGRGPSGVEDSGAVVGGGTVVDGVVVEVVGDGVVVVVAVGWSTWIGVAPAPAAEPSRASTVAAATTTARPPARRGAADREVSWGGGFEVTMVLGGTDVLPAPAAFR
jgi:hypothetical protein